MCFRFRPTFIQPSSSQLKFSACAKQKKIVIFYTLRPWEYNPFHSYSTTGIIYHQHNSIFVCKIFYAHCSIPSMIYGRRKEINILYAIFLIQAWNWNRIQKSCSFWRIYKTFDLSCVVLKNTISNRGPILRTPYRPNIEHIRLIKL